MEEVASPLSPLAGAGFPPVDSNAAETSFHLRKDCKPLHYSIHWTFVPGAPVLLGTITIKVKYHVYHDSNQPLSFRLNALGLKCLDTPTIVAAPDEPPFSPPTGFPPSPDSSIGSSPLQASPLGAPAPFTASQANSNVVRVPSDLSLAPAAAEFTPDFTAESVVVEPEPDLECWRISFRTVGRTFATGDDVVFSITLRCETPISPISVVKDANQRSGVYRWSNQEPDAIVTHLEPTHARKLYPCFDDPYFRATYQVTLTHPTSLVARSSTADEEETFEGVLRTVRFARTISLPSYLVSFCTGDLQCVTAETKRGVKCSVWFSKHHPNGTGYFALDLMVTAVQFYEEYFQFPLPAVKVDMIAIEALPVLGMENWGMVTIDEEYLLVRDATTTERRRRIARLIGHEIVHHWFGNIISLDGWRFIWLKEGMARYMEFVFVHHCRPKWQIWTDFLAQVQAVALTQDANAAEDTAHAVETEPPSNPRHVFDLFDVISYGKAASIIRMVAAAMGDERFAAALRQFFRLHAYQSVSSASLFKCWGDEMAFTSSQASEVQGQGSAGRDDFSAVIAHWVTTVGHPYVFVEKYGSGLRLSQFLMASKEVGFLDSLRPVSANERSPRLSQGPTTLTPPPGAMHRHSHNSLQLVADGRKPVSIPISIEELRPCTFWIPLRVTEIEQGQTTVTKQIEMNAQTLNIASQSYAWFHTSGFGAFHCDYDVSSWERIFEVYPFFSVLDRLSICMDVMELRAFHIGVFPSDSLDRCLLLPKLLQALHEKKENHNFIWSYVAPNLIELVSLTRQGPVWAVLRTFLLRVTRHLVDNRSATFFGQPSEDVSSVGANMEFSTKTLADTLRLLALLQSPDIVLEAKEYFYWIMSAMSPDFAHPERQTGPADLDAIDSERAAAAMEAVGIHGTTREWSAMYWVHKRYVAKQKGVAFDDAATNAGPGELDQIRFHAAAVWPDHLLVALLCGIVSRDSGEVGILDRQLEIARSYSSLGGAVPPLVCNTKLLSTIIDAEAGATERKQRVPSLNSILRGTMRACSSAIVAQQLQGVANSQSTGNPSMPPLATQCSRAILRNAKWVDYISEFYLQFLHRYHARTSSGISIDSGSGSQSIGT